MLKKEGRKNIGSLGKGQFKIIYAQGLPAKSYLHVVNLDFFLRGALSYLVDTNFFDVYIASFLSWKYKYPTREANVKSFISYMICYDHSRIDFLLGSRFILRSIVVNFLRALSLSISKYKEIVDKGVSNYTSEDMKYLFLAKHKWEPRLAGILISIPDIVQEINRQLDRLISSYLEYVIHGLMKRRKGESNPRSLTTDAYDAFITMLDSYNPEKSRVPFHRYLNFFVKEVKNKVIKRENWDLETGKIVPIGNLKDDRGQDEKDMIYYSPYYVSKLLSDQRSQERIRDVVDMLGVYIPRQLYEILMIYFGLVNPLTTEEEVILELNK